MSYSARWCAWLCVLLPVAVCAGPGLRLDPLCGPLSERFAGQQPTAFVAGGPLLPDRSRGLIVQSVEVDSMGMIHYGRRVSGFTEGPTVTVEMDDYLDLEYRAEQREIWRRLVRRDFRSTALEQRRRKGSRFEWTVPFSAPKPLQRFIGDEGPSLRLNGSRTIIISGKSEWTDGEVQTSFGRSSKFPSLAIDQESKFTVEGKVGELINVRIDQDTESLGSAFGSNLGSNLGDQLSNQIKLDYKGEDDSIFQEVQAGNTTLELPNTRFVGFRQQNKGLFGIRAKGHLGPFAFTTVASHEKSKSNRQTFKGGAAVDTLEIKDYQYIRNTYFFLHEFYRANLPDFRSLLEGAQFGAENFVNVNSLEVYINDFNTNNDAELFAKPGIAWVDESDTLGTAEIQCFDAAGNRLQNSGCFEEGTWHRLDPDDDYAVVAEAGYIILQRPISEPHAMAVHFKTLDQGFNGPLQRETGRLNTGTAADSLQLKLIKARNARPGFPTWNLEWKNVYRIASGFSSGRKFDPKTLQVDIVKEVSGQEDQPSQNGRAYLKLLGLDERGKDPGSPSDRVIDADYIGLDDFRGHLIFPDQRPFDPRAPKYRGRLEETIPEIYDNQQQRDQIEASRYKMLVRAASSEQRIRLGGAFGGVRPETVEVRLNNRQLTRGSDYNVDFVGNVTFVGNVAQEVADPGADLEISFESEDILGLGSQQKTLLGLRSEYEFWGGDGRIGSTMIYNNERSSERRVRVGNEPKRTVIWNFDVRAHREAPILTRLVDMLPLIKTATPSEITLDAELAQSRPNLNTKDKGYIDDFEGSERPTSLAIGRTRWSPSSVPGDALFAEADRGRFIWYNPFDGIQRTDIWPNQEEQLEAQNRRADILALELFPNPEVVESWGGVVTALSAVNDFSQSKFLEVWVRGEQGMLHVDLGDQINEDYRANGRLDTEDEPFPGRSTGDGLVSKEEDVGIDGRDDEAELNYYLLLADAGFDTTLSLDQRKQAYAAVYGSDLLQPNRSADDPEGDNWRYEPNRNKNDYSRINGTQRNKADLESGDRPDTEDLNNNGVLDQRDNYYHYQIDLASDRYEVPGTQSEGWRQIRVPLFGDHVGRVGLPDSSRIEYARLMLSSAPLADPAATVLAEIALIEVVGNEWQEDDVVRLDERYMIGEEEALDVTVIGTDKSLSYRPPPGVKLRRNVQSRTREREQSLVLAYEGLEPGHQMSATKILTRQANYTNYQRLRMYVHGDSTETSDYVRGDSSDLELFVRFGADTTNYYEVVSPVFPGWTNGRKGWKGNQVDVDLLAISQLKALLHSGRADTTTGKFFYTYAVRDARGAPIDGKVLLHQDELEKLRAEGYDPRVDRYALNQVFSRPRLRDGEQAVYRVRGNPSMQVVKQLSIGLRNRASSRVYSGRIFLDELRLDEARNDPGLAAFARLNTKMADFMSVDGNVLWRQEDFRSFAGSGGNSTDREASMSASSNAQKILPGGWGFSIPVKVNLSRGVSLPRFGPGSDVELTPEQKREQQAASTREFYDVSISRRQGKNFLLRWTLDQMNLRMSHSRENSTDPVRLENAREAQTASFNYRMPLPKPSLEALKWLPGFMPEGLRALRFRPLPSSMSYTMNGSRRVSRLLHRGDAEATEQEDFGLNETYTSKLNPFQGLAVDYNLKIDRDLRKKWKPDARSFGREVGRKQNADVSFSLRPFQWLDGNTSFKANYEERNDPAQRRGVAPIDSTTGAPFKTLDIITRNDKSLRLNFKLPLLLKNLGKSASKTPKKRREIEVDEGETKETAERPSETVETPERKSPFILRRLLGWTGTIVEPINTSWRWNNDARNFNLTARPPIVYQVGIVDTLRVRRATQGLTTQDNWAQTASLEASTGMRLPMGISLKVNSNDQTTKRSGSSQDRSRIQRDFRFPRLTVNWGRADRIPFVKKVINSAQVNVSYEGSTNSEGEGRGKEGLSARNLITEGTSTEIRASWNGRWRWGPTTTIERVISRGESRDFELAAAEDDSSAGVARPLRGTSSNERVSTTFKVTHKLKPRSLPLFGKLKSDMSLNFEFSVEGEIRANGTADEARTPITDTDRWRTKLSLSYSFSENFRGEGLVRIENNDNRLTDKTRKTRELRLSGTFYLR